MKADAYALLGLPRRASLPAGEIRSAFQKLAAGAHPDGASDAAETKQRTAGFTALNEARAILSSLARRLRHLLELEYPESSAPATGTVMDGAMMDLFAAASDALAAASFVQQRQRRTTTALARAMLSGEEMTAREAVESALALIDRALNDLETDMAEADRLRDSGGNAATLLQSCAARAGFLEKWQAKLREAFSGFLLS